MVIERVDKREILEVFISTTDYSLTNLENQNTFHIVGGSQIFSTHWTLTEQISSQYHPVLSHEEEGGVIFKISWDPSIFITHAEIF